VNPEVEKLFEEAAAATGAERAGYLERNCSDPEIRREVELLLSHDQEAESALTRVVSRAATSVLQSFALPAGHRIGAYRIVSVIGQGGMGCVYLADRVDGRFEQQVAIKVVQAGQHMPWLAQRLQQEYRILAGLQHPNIARLLDAGVMESGLPYFVMEYVAGEPIDGYCEKHELSLRDRLRLFLEVCDSVHYAHQKLIVHRDLKPDNILVTEQGLPKLLDFGIAKVLGDAPGMEVTLTQALTPAYASPEQMRGEPVTTASDVYSLGGVLYKVLTGLPPHQLEKKSPLESVQAICEEEVRDPATVRRELTGDAAHILQMALRKEPARRYRSVQEFADDVQRLLEHMPVLASPDSAWYRGQKFLLRHAIGAIATAMVLVALITGISVALWQARRAERRFGQVRNLADVFLFDFEKRIRDVPGTLEARKMVAGTAREYLASLAADARGDQGLTRELAESHYRLSAIETSTGENEAALGDLNQALTLWRSVKDDCCGTGQQRRLYIKALLDLATLQRRSGQLQEARGASDEAMRWSRAWMANAPDDTDAQHALLDALFADSVVSGGEDKPTQYRDKLLEFVALSDKLAARSPQDDSFFYNQARTENSLIALCVSTGDLVRGRDAGLHARRILDGLIEKNPDNMTYRELRVRTVANTSQVLRTMAGDDASVKPQMVEQTRIAYEFASENERRDPQNQRAADLAVVMKGRYAEALDDVGRHSEALSLENEILPKLDALLAKDPKNHRNQYMHLELDAQKAMALMGLNRLQEADAMLAKGYARLLNTLATQPKPDQAFLDLEITLLNNQTKLARKMGQLERAREHCQKGMELAASLIRQDALNEKEFADLPELRKQAVALGIGDSIASMAGH